MTYAPGPYGYGYAPVPPPPKPGVIPLAPLDLNHVLGGAFAAYRRHWKALLGITLVAYALAAAVIAGVGTAAWAGLSDEWAHSSAAEDVSLSDLMPLLTLLGVLWLACAVGMLLATGLLHAAVAVVVQEAVLGRRVGFGTVWRRAWSRLGAVLGTVLVSAAAAVVPALLFLVGLFLVMAAVIASIGADDGTGAAGWAVTGVLFFLLALAATPPALWLWVKFNLAPTAAVVESAGTLTALRRSAQLVRGAWWRIFGYTLVMLLIVGGVTFVMQMVVSLTTQASLFAAPLAQHATPGTVFFSMGTAAVVSTLLMLLTQAVLGPLQPLASGLLYVDQRIRRENLAPVLAQAADRAHA
ncbi:oxidoreductase [Streptomyces sp. NPDC002262]|uniref:oxidoreductase n=1 Tax=Streptomyces sp. NPDC002262 TaxID=3154414 RepID=UPI00331A3FEF